MSQVRLHSSNPNLCAELADFQTPVTRLTDSIDNASDYIKLQEDFCVIAQKGEQNLHVSCTASHRIYIVLKTITKKTSMFFAGMNQS